MVQFDAVTGGNLMLSNSGGVTKSYFSFTHVKSITIPATGFVDNLRFLRPVETILFDTVLNLQLFFKNKACLTDL